MNKYVVVIMGLQIVTAGPPKLTIDCRSQDLRDSHILVPPFFKSKSAELPSGIDVHKICSIIRTAIPKPVKHGKFIIIGEADDQERSSNNEIPISLPPPRDLFSKIGHKLKTPRIKVPKIKVPTLKATGPLGSPRRGAPRVGAPMTFHFRARERDREDAASSAERMEKFKKGVQKMLHVVKVLGQIDQYVSERTRIIIDMLSRTFSNDKQ